MDIGKEDDAVIVKPAQLPRPLRRRKNEPTPKREPIPEKEPEKVGV